MKKPKSVVIFGKRIPVRYKDLSDEDHDGSYDRKTNLITIHDKLKGEKHDFVLLHEMFHAVAERTGLRQGLSDELEEIIAELGAAWIVDNFKLQLK